MQVQRIWRFYLFTKDSQPVRMAEWSKAPDSSSNKLPLTEVSGPRMGAWVRIPLLTDFFSLLITLSQPLRSFFFLLSPPFSPNDWPLMRSDPFLFRCYLSWIPFFSVLRFVMKGAFHRTLINLGASWQQKEPDGNGKTCTQTRWLQTVLSSRAIGIVVSCPFSLAEPIKN